MRWPLTLLSPFFSPPVTHSVGSAVNRRLTNVRKETGIGFTEGYIVGSGRPGNWCIIRTALGLERSCVRFGSGSKERGRSKSENQRRKLIPFNSAGSHLSNDALKSRL